MIATPTWINANSAMQYHTESKDNYYKKEGDLGEWQGKGAEALGFTGKITEKELEKALWGKDIEGNEVVGVRLDKDGDRKRAALDLTFNAPKSVSVLMEMANAIGNKELANSVIKAHEKAVSKGIDKFEKLMQTRETIDGKTEKYLSGNIAVAKFTHSVARPVKDENGKTTVDPSLHTHAVVMNITKAKDGSFKAIETGEIFKNYMKIGAQYRMELANNLRELGFDIRITNQNQAFFEVDLKSKNDDKLIEAFSNRSKQLNDTELIKELKEKYPNKSNSEIKQMAAYHSREWKGEIDREAILKDNLQRGIEAGFNKEKFKEVDKSKNETLSYFQKLDKAEKYLENAVYALSEENSVFNRNDIVTTAAKMGFKDGINPEIFEDILDENKNIIELKDGYYTTKEILNAEKELIESVKDEKNIKQVYFKKDAKELVKNYSKKLKEKSGYGLTKGQQEATAHILSSKNQVIGIQGDAGVGKTTMLKALNELKTDDTKIVGLSYTGKAANEIELKTTIKSKEIFKAAGIESSTVSSFLYKYDKGYLELNGDKKLKIVVDEASMLGTKDTKKLIDIAKQTNAQLVLIGDEKQFKAISAGDPFTLLKNYADMKTVSMNEVLRQKDRTLKSAVWALNQYDSPKAFEILDKKGLIQESDKGVNEIVKEYFKDDEKDKLAVVAGKNSYKDNIILTNTNDTKDEINEQIRERLQLKNEIGNENIAIGIKQSSNLSPSKQFLASSYKDSSKVLLQATINEELKVGREFNITDINEKQNSLTLDDRYEVELKEYGRFLQAYKEKEIKLRKNEKVIFTKNDKNLGINNGESVILKEIDKNGNATFYIEDKNKEISFNLKSEYNYIDYGYAITTMKSQGQTAKNVIAYMKGEYQDFNSFYVATTRAEKSLKIFTDNKEKLKDFIQIEQVKYNATTLWQQLDKKEKDRIEKYTKEIKEKKEEEKASDKQLDFAKKISEELHIELDSNKKIDVKNFIDSNLDNYNKSLQNAPASDNQLKFSSKIADTLYINLDKDNLTHKEAKEFINNHIEIFKEAMDNRHEYFLQVDPNSLQPKTQEKYYTDLLKEIGKEKEFDRAFELINKYNENNEVGIYEKMVQTDKLAETLNIKGIDIANKTAEQSFEEEYIDVWRLKDNPYETEKHINEYTDMKYQDAKEFAKIELIEEKIDDKFFERFDELDKKAQVGEIKEEIVKEFLEFENQKSRYLQDTKEELAEYFEIEQIKSEICEYIQEGDIYEASKLLEENKDRVEEFDYKSFEEQIDMVMSQMLEIEAKMIEKDMEKMSEVENELEEYNLKEEISDEKELEKNTGERNERGEFENRM